MLYRFLSYIDVSPLEPGTYFSRQAINSIKLPLLITDKNMQKNIKCFRLCTWIYPKTSKILFVLEPAYLNPASREVEDCYTSNYLEDIRNIIHNVYGLHGVTFTQECGISVFTTKLNDSTKEYSLADKLDNCTKESTLLDELDNSTKEHFLLDVKAIMFIYNNPIVYLNNYLTTNSITPNQTHNYSLLVKSTLFYFHVGLNSSGTKCVTRIWWEGYDVYEGFCYTDLQDELNDRLLTYFPRTIVDVTESHSLGFKYYKEGVNHILKSECAIEGSIYITRYLICILTGKLVYTTESDLLQFLYQYEE